MDENKAPYGRIIYPHLMDGAPDAIGDGTDMINVFARAADKAGVRTFMEHAVTKAVLSDHGDEIVGVIAETPRGPVALRAHRGVIFGSGGFTHNKELRTASLPGPSSAAVPPAPTPGTCCRSHWRWVLTWST